MDAGSIRRRPQLAPTIAAFELRALIAYSAVGSKLVSCSGWDDLPVARAERARQFAAQLFEPG
jgi:hypothetical protein